MSMSLADSNKVPTIREDLETLDSMGCSASTKPLVGSYSVEGSCLMSVESN